MKTRSKQRWKRGGKIIILAFLIAFCLRLLVIESVYISTDQMEKTYSKGDLVFISKLAYGIRVPFTSTTLLEKPVRRNDLVLFRVPQTKRDAKILSRCVGLSGDTVAIVNGRLTINGFQATTPPTLLPICNAGKGLSKLEAYLVAESQNTKEVEQINEANPYKVVVPKAGMGVVVDSIAIQLYSAIFADENSENAVVIKDNALYINNQKQQHYLFKENYYWVLSDNREKGIDSRDLGFISEKNIEGKALRVWFNCNFLSYE